MKIYLLIIALFIGIVSGFAQSANKWLLVCGDSYVLIVDYPANNDSIPNVVWKWNAHEAKDLPDDFRTKKFNTVDDCKAINQGTQLLVSSSSGAIAVIEQKTSRVLFHANVPNAHSIELLPNGLIAAAASTAKEGNRIMLFDPKNSDKPIYSDSLYSAHGLVWDTKQKCLYALGFDVLRQYQLIGGKALKLVQEWKIPGEGGHDLQMAPNGNSLFLTETTGSWQFDLTKHTFAKISGFPDTHDVKSLGQNNAGQFIYTSPEKSWWTYHVRFLNPTRMLRFPNMKVYKARWFEP